MNYSKLFERAWEIIWKNKFLIILGILVSLGGWGSSSNTSSAEVEGDVFISNPLQIISNLPALFQENELPVSALILGGLVFLVGLGFWLISTISRGGLIFAADRLSKGQTTNFATSLRAGWDKGWRLIGIGLIPLLPMLPLIASAFAAFGIFNTRSVITPEESVANFPNAVVVVPIVVGLLLLVLALSILRTFANRACMLEDLGVFNSYRRALVVIGNNLGPALALFLLQIVISIVIWLVLFLPGILIALCCILWPLLLGFQGVFAAFYSTLWTLAWDHWTQDAKALAGAEM